MHKTLDEMRLQFIRLCSEKKASYRPSFGKVGKNYLVDNFLSSVMGKKSRTLGNDRRSYILTHFYSIFTLKNV